MDSPHLLSLAGRVEAASGPCRELDALIHFTVNQKWIGRVPTWPPTKVYRPDMETGFYMVIEGDGYFYGDSVPVYTASIDAAMTLVPVGFEVSMYGAVGSISPQAQLETQQMRDNHDYPISGKGASIALALCAAALKARSDCLARYGEDIFGDGK